MSTLVAHQDALWLGALAAAPVALLVATLCRGIARPGTRHAMWCLVLLTFVVPGLLMATGWAGGINAALGDAARGVPAMLSWAFPPERAEIAAPDQDSAPGAVGGTQASPEPQADPTTIERSVPAPNRTISPDRDAHRHSAAADGTPELLDVPMAGAADPVRPVIERDTAIGAIADLGSRPAVATPPEPEHRVGQDSPAPAGATGPWLDDGSWLALEIPGEATAAPLGISADAPTGLSPARRLHAALIDGPKPDLGVGMSSVGQIAAAGRAQPRPPVRGGLIEPESAADAAPSGPTPLSAAATPIGPRSRAPQPAEIRDPVWNALESSVEGLSAWAGSIQRAVARVVEIPAPPAALWGSGIALVLVVGAGRALAGRASVRRMTPVDRSDRRLVEDVARRLGLPRAPSAVLVRSRVSPMVVGWLNPRIVLPESLWRGLDLDARRAVLTHELAHLRRRDQWVRLVELVVGVVYWWHPVLWAVRRRIREEADLCCDAWVTTLFPGLRRSYAEALLRTRVYLSIPGAVAPVAGLGMASARSRRFSRRLTMVMTGQNRPKASPLGVALAVAVGTVTLVVAPSLAHPSLLRKGGAPCPPETASSTAPAQPNSRATGVTVPSGTRAHGGYAGGGRGGAVNTTSVGSGGAHAHGHAPDGHTLDHAAHIYTDTPVSTATTVGGGFGGSSGGMFYGGVAAPASDDGVDARLRALEARLERMDAMLQRLLERAESRASSTMPVMSQSLLSSPQFELAMAQPAGDEEVIWRAYTLPEGKFDALWDLMSRDDVPVWVRAEDGGIGFEGTPAQQEVFARFLAMIHPEGAEEYASAFFGQDWSGDPFAADAHSAHRAALEAELAAQAAAHEHHAAALADQAHALEAHLAARMEHQRRALIEQQAALEAQREALSQQAEHLEAEALRLEELASTFEARAARARNDEQRESLEAYAEALREQADAVREAADEAREAWDEMAFELDEAMAEMEADEADARAELEEALLEMRAELEAAAAGGHEHAENCACDDECSGEGCADDCDEDCHCRTGATAPTAPAAAAAPARPARAAQPARPAQPARAATPATPARPAAPATIRD